MSEGLGYSGRLSFHSILSSNRNVVALLPCNPTTADLMTLISCVQASRHTMNLFPPQMSTSKPASARTNLRLATSSPTTGTMFTSKR